MWARAEAARHVCNDIEIVIDGSQNVASVTPLSVREVINGYSEPIIGRPIHSINTLSIAEYLRKFNNFESVDCIITSQGNLKVRVVPMVPALRIFDGGKSYYVNKDGKTMAAIPGFHVDVPIVTGEFNNRIRPQEILPVVRFMQSDSMLNRLIGMIQVKDMDNILLVPRIKGHVINIGDTTRLKEKRDAIYTAYRSILPYKGWETYDTISVKFRGQIVASRRDKTPLFPIPVMDSDEDPEEETLMLQPDSMPLPVKPKKKPATPTL